MSTVACHHCGLPAPDPIHRDVLAFCCNGCRGAYELIGGWGLEDFYQLRQSNHSSRVGEFASRFDDLDRPELLGLSAPMPVDGSTIDSGDAARLMQSRLSISGLHCAACLWLLERAPVRVDGWHSARVRMQSRTIDITFDPGKIPLSQIAIVLDQLGYHVAPLAKDGGDEAAETHRRQFLVDIAVAGFCAANAMWLAIALYAGSFTGIDPGHAFAFRVAGVLLGCVAIIFPGRVFFRSAMASIRTRTPHMDLPVSIGLLAGLGGSLYGLMDGQRDVYFDSIASLVFFLLVGRWFQMRFQRRAGDEVADLVRLTPAVATRRDDDGQTKRVSANDLAIGDVVVVAAGESFPVDGTVIAGSTKVDRSLMTGESRPVNAAVGDQVTAGTDNMVGSVDVRASAVGRLTSLAKMTEAVTEAASQRTAVVQLANRIGGVFVVVVLALAMATGVIWYQRDPAVVIDRVVALLIVACPCALALATPLAIAASIGQLAKRRVLVRSGESLERISRPGVIFFDKTGTLTRGHMRVVCWEGDETTLSIAASAEAEQTHPIAAALKRYAKESLNDNREIHWRSIETIAGCGIRAITEAGQECLIGNRRHIGDIALGNFADSISAIVDRGQSPILVAIDGDLRGVFSVQDQIRDESMGLVRWLKKNRWRVCILSGDATSTARRVAGELGIEPECVYAEQTPQQKLGVIRQASVSSTVVMVGDGLNDASALAAADVGIALGARCRSELASPGGAAGTSLSAAPVVLAGGTLEGIKAFILMAKNARRIIARNFAISLIYNVLAVGLAMAGWINPLIAAVFMPVSSLTVILATLAGTRISKVVV